MKYNFKRKISPLIKNFISMILLYGSNYVIPLITLPYLLRILGPDQYGIIAYSQATVQYLLILTDYGFSFNATRDISINRDKPTILSKIFTAVMIIKIILTLVGFGVMEISIQLIPSMLHQREAIYASFGLVIGNMLFPTWFFQGIEQMGYITIINFVGRITYLLSILIFVTRSDQVIVAISINSISVIFVGIVALIVVVNRFKLQIIFNSNMTWELISGGFFFLLSRLSISLYTVSNSVLLGATGHLTLVAYYNIAEKIINLVKTPFELLSTVIFPYISSTRDVRLIKKMMQISLVLSFVILLVVLLYAPTLVRLLGGESYLGAVQLLRIFALTVPLASILYLLGSSTLVALGKGKYYNFSILLSALLYITIVPVMIYKQNVNLLSLGWVVVFVEVGMVIFQITAVFKLGLLVKEKILEAKCNAPTS